MSYIIPNIVYYAVCRYISNVFHQFSRFQDTHALVKFLEEDATAIVPVHRIQQKETLEYGGSCGVVWNNKKVYKGFLICSGILSVDIGELEKFMLD